MKSQNGTEYAQNYDVMLKWIAAALRGETLEILPEEVEVRAEARSGLVVASEGAYLAALKTDLTPELVREGLAREFVRRVQDMLRDDFLP